MHPHQDLDTTGRSLRIRGTELYLDPPRRCALGFVSHAGLSSRGLTSTTTARGLRAKRQMNRSCAAIMAAPRPPRDASTVRSGAGTSPATSAKSLVLVDSL